MFTDTEVALTLAHARSSRTFARDAQALVDEMDADIRALRRKLVATEAALATERVARRKAELKLATLFS